MLQNKCIHCWVGGKVKAHQSTVRIQPSRGVNVTEVWFALTCILAYYLIILATTKKEQIKTLQ